MHYQEISNNPERIINIKLFTNQYCRKKSNFLHYRKIKKKNPNAALGVPFVNDNDIEYVEDLHMKQAHTSKYKS